MEARQVTSAACSEGWDSNRVWLLATPLSARMNARRRGAPGAEIGRNTADLIRRVTCLGNPFDNNPRWLMACVA